MPTRRQHPVGRLDRGDAAEGGRPDHRAAGLRSEGEGHHPGRDGGGRTGGGAARACGSLARIAGRDRVEIGEGRRRGLAEDRGAGPLRRHDDGRVGLGPPAGIDRRAAFGRQVGGVDDVLDADRDAASGPARPTGAAWSTVTKAAMASSPRAIASRDRRTASAGDRAPASMRRRRSRIDSMGGCCSGMAGSSTPAPPGSVRSRRG